MSGQAKEIELLQLLNRHEVLRLRGYSFTLGPQGVIADRWGHVRGVWRADGEKYAWTTAGYNEPVHESEDAAAAVRYTLVTLITT